MRAIARRPKALGWGLPCSNEVESLGKGYVGFRPTPKGVPLALKALGECVPGGATGQTLPGAALEGAGIWTRRIAVTS